MKSLVAFAVLFLVASMALAEDPVRRLPEENIVRVVLQLEELPTGEAEEATEPETIDEDEFKPIGAITASIDAEPGDTPEVIKPKWMEATEGGEVANLDREVWQDYAFHWRATGLCHRPLYFEQVNLERYGYACCPVVQETLSAAHFYGSIAALPYKMSVDCPHECVYTLGHYRPGSCAPRYLHCLPLDPKAAALQGGAVTGMLFLFP